MSSAPLFDVSVIVTVYNKEKYIADTVRSLTEQAGSLRVEYIFADDVSTDGTLPVLEACTRDIPNVTIIRNSTNAGPSVRLNQAARLAQGKYLLCFDSDDILAANAISRMFELLVANGADVIYGQWEKTTLPGPELIGRKIPDDALFEVSDSPLEFVLRGRFLRMALMVKRDVFLQAGGADERIFIQDESLPLRLAANCKRFIALYSPIMFVPFIEGALSGNKSQLNHDRFLANYYLLHDYPSISPEANALTTRRCISAMWKQARHESGFAAHFSPVFRQYLASQALGSVSGKTLQRGFEHFSSLANVRRTKAG